MSDYNMPDGCGVAFNADMQRARATEVEGEIKQLTYELRVTAEKLAQLRPDDVSTALLDTIFELEALLDS